MITSLWFSNLLSWSAQVALLTLAAGLLAKILQLRQPWVLLTCWRALLAISLLLPLLQPWRLVRVVAFLTLAPATIGAKFLSSGDVSTAHWRLPSLLFVSRPAIVVVGAGITLRFAVLFVGLLKLRQLRRTSSPLPSSAGPTALLEEMRTRMDARAEFRLSSRIESPVTFGFSVPVILLPERFPSLNPQFQAAIACHELLHVRRHDWAHHLAEEIVRCAFWFHPAMAWLIARLRLAREQVVDLEVLRFTRARKPYLEALLQFAAPRAGTAMIPAPPFLVERQLAERVSLMLKEASMSRTRLIASLAAVTCGVVLATTVAVRLFPLRAVLYAAPAPSPSAVGVKPRDESSRAEAAAKAATSPQTSSSSVDRSNIWVDTVKRGPMVRQVRGLGVLAHGENANLLARISVPDFMAQEVQPNQAAVVDTRKGLVKGHVIHIDTPSNGTRSVDIGLDAALPRGVGADTPIDGTIDIERLNDILFVGRPVHGAANASVPVFKIVNDGKEAVRVNVKFGRASVQTIEVLDGLKLGDAIILSDMSNYDSVDRLRLN